VWKSYEDVPGWKFSEEEVSPGYYRVEGRDAAGRSVSLGGTDPDRLLHDAKAWARENADGAPSRADDVR
jgi:hypothetical protein